MWRNLIPGKGKTRKRRTDDDLPAIPGGESANVYEGQIRPDPTYESTDPYRAGAAAAATSAAASSTADEETSAVWFLRFGRTPDAHAALRNQPQGAFVIIPDPDGGFRLFYRHEMQTKQWPINADYGGVHLHNSPRMFESLEALVGYYRSWDPRDGELETPLRMPPSSGRPSLHGTVPLGGAAAAAASTDPGEAPAPALPPRLGSRRERMPTPPHTPDQQRSVTNASQSPATSSLAKSEMLDVPVEQWSIGDVADWLQHRSLHDCVATFRENKIDGAALLVIGADDLKELGIKALGDRAKLLHAIQTLQAHRTRALSSPSHSSRASSRDPIYSTVKKSGTSSSVASASSTQSLATDHQAPPLDFVVERQSPPKRIGRFRRSASLRKSQGSDSTGNDHDMIESLRGVDNTLEQQAQSQPGSRSGSFRSQRSPASGHTSLLLSPATPVLLPGSASTSPRNEEEASDSGKKSIMRSFVRSFRKKRKPSEEAPAAFERTNSATGSTGSASSEFQQNHSMQQLHALMGRVDSAARRQSFFIGPSSNDKARAELDDLSYNGAFVIHVNQHPSPHLILTFRQHGLVRQKEIVHSQRGLRLTDTRSTFADLSSLVQFLCSDNSEAPNLLRLPRNDVPAESSTDGPEEEYQHLSEPWFYSYLSFLDASTMLEHETSGTYLVRAIGSKSYELVYTDSGHVYSKRIENLSGGGVALQDSELQFPTLCSLIRYYSTTIAADLRRLLGMPPGSRPVNRRVMRSNIGSSPGMVDDVIPSRSTSWWKSSALETRKAADRLVADGEDGSFFMRYSCNPRSFILIYKFENRIFSEFIHSVHNNSVPGVTLAKNPNQSFSSLQDLVRYLSYRRHPHLRCALILNDETEQPSPRFARKLTVNSGGKSVTISPTPMQLDASTPPSRPGDSSSNSSRPSSLRRSGSQRGRSITGQPSGSSLRSNSSSFRRERKIETDDVAQFSKAAVAAGPPVTSGTAVGEKTDGTSSATPIKVQQYPSSPRSRHASRVKRRDVEEDLVPTNSAGNFNFERAQSTRSSAHPRQRSSTSLRRNRSFHESKNSPAQAQPNDFSDLMHSQSHSASMVYLAEPTPGNRGAGRYRSVSQTGGGASFQRNFSNSSESQASSVFDRSVSDPYPSSRPRYYDRSYESLSLSMEDMAHLAVSQGASPRQTPTIPYSHAGASPQVIRRQGPPLRSESLRVPRTAVVGNAVDGEGNGGGWPQPRSFRRKKPIWPWLQVGIPRDEALSHLQGMPNGAFVVRISEKHPNTFLVSYVYGERICHEPLWCSQGDLSSPKISLQRDRSSVFSSLEQLLRHYTKHQGPLLCPLVFPDAQTGAQPTTRSKPPFLRGRSFESLEQVRAEADQRRRQQILHPRLDARALLAPWCCLGQPREQAVSKLRGGREGSFVIRDTRSFPMFFATLTMIAHGRLYQTHLEDTTAGLHVRHANVFMPSLSELVAYYSQPSQRDLPVPLRPRL
eukprot:m.21818 g.21818  ORF g.21818 m.21818 type:complete len:1474 (+) comp3956_c0_seq2:226-4647(+)